MKKPNGYVYSYPEPVKCEVCPRLVKGTGYHKEAKLYEHDGKKVCNWCGKENNLL